MSTPNLSEDNLVDTANANKLILVYGVGTGKLLPIPLSYYENMIRTKLHQKDQTDTT